MSTGDQFYFLGQSGAYNISDTASAAAQQNMANYANGLGAVSYSGLLGGNIWHQGTTTSAGSIVASFATVPSALSDYIAKAQEPAKQAKRKLKGILANLRSEIDGWHGDVLERCPA